MFGLGTAELILILVIVLLFFLRRKLPTPGASLARGSKSFGSNMSDHKAKYADDQIIEVEPEKNKSA